MMQADLSNSSKVIEFFIEKQGSKLNLQNADTFIKNVEGVTLVEVDPSSGKTKIILKEDTIFEKKFIEIQSLLLKAGYKIKVGGTDGVQAVLFFGTMVLGFLFVAVVMTLFYYMGGSLPSLF